MPVFRRQSLRAQVVFAAFFWLLPLFIAILYSAFRTRDERIAELRETTISVAVTAAAYLDGSLERYDALASGLLRHPAVQAFDTPTCDALFAAILREQPLLTNVSLLDRGSVVRGSALPSPGGLLERAWMTALLSTGAPQVEDYGVGALTGKPVGTLAYPVKDASGAIAGALVLTIDLAAYQAVFARIPLPEGSIVMVTDRSGRLLVRSRDSEHYVGRAGAAIDPSVLPRASERAGVDGIPRLYGDANAKRVPWVVSVGVPTAIVPQRLSPLFQRNLAIALAALIGGVLLMLWLTRRVSTQLDVLRANVHRMASGDLSRPRLDEAPSRELAELQDGFITMAANMQEARSALDQRVEHERQLNERMQGLQRQVVRQERMAAVGLLASGIAHEISNPLQAMLGGAEMLERSGDVTDEGRRQVAHLKMQGMRAMEILRSLGRFSSQHPAVAAPLALGDVVAEVMKLRQRDGDTAVVSVDVNIASTRQVFANFSEITQVVLSFVLNAERAVRAMPPAQARVLVRVIDVGPDVRLEVHDNGAGVPPADEPKLFQPFFTTRPVGEGTGLALSVGYAIIEASGGTMGYAAGETGGATFFFALPALTADTLVDHDRTAVLQRPH